MRFIDLYCGAGFGGRGAVNAGYRPVLAVDAWEIASKTYKDNFPEAMVVTGRVEDPGILALAQNCTVDVLLASPECTSHSVARGAREGCEKSRETAINILPWIRTIMPRWVVIENVARMGQWKRHSEFKTEIETMGYSISELLLNAAEFGASQARKRLFMVCDRLGTPPELSEIRRKYSRQHRTVRSIIDWQVNWPTSPLFTPERAKNTLQRAERAITHLGEGVPFLVVYYGTDHAGGWQSLDMPLRTITTVDRFALVTFVNGEYRMRMLQPSELARAMGAEQHILKNGNRRDKVKLCGNGVCSVMTEILFKELSVTDERVEFR